MGKLTESFAVSSSATNTIAKAPTSEQLRLAQLLVDPKTEDHSVMSEKINKVMELTRCNESTALVALHDSDNDVAKAVDNILEGRHEDEWIVREGKKSKKLQQQQSQQPHYRHRQQQHISSENHYGADENDGHHVENAADDNSPSFGAPYNTRGSGRGMTHGGGDFPPRFRGRGGSMRGRRLNDSFEHSVDGEDGRWRGRGRGFGGDRGRGRGFPSRGGRRGSGLRREGGTDQEFGNWNSSELESNTWDNSMANACNSKPSGKADGRRDEWKSPEESNTWDNSMAQAAAPVKPKKHQSSNEWNSNTGDDWGGEEDWSKLRDGLIVEPSGGHKQVAGPAPKQDPSSFTAAPTSSGNVRGESIDVNMLFNNQPSENHSSQNLSQAVWTAKQATADLKNELGIGKVSNSIGHARQVEQIPAKQVMAKVELPSNVGRSTTGPIDVQFGDMALLSDSQPLFTFDGSAVFKSQASTGSSHSQDRAIRQEQMDSSVGVYQRTQKSEHVTGPELLLGTGEIGSVDISPGAFTVGGAYAATLQEKPNITKNATSNVSTVTGGNQRNLLSNSGGGGGVNVPVQVPVNETLSKEMGLPLNMGTTQSSVGAANFHVASNQLNTRPPVSTGGAAKPQVATSLCGNSNMAQYQQQQAVPAAGVSPYMNMYDHMSFNSVGFLPPQNLFLNAGGFNMRALTQIPPIAASTATGLESAGVDYTYGKAPFMRQDTGSNLAAGLANLSVPPPGLPAPTASNAEQAAQILSMAGMYPTLPFINPAAPPFLAPQFLVPNVSSASNAATGAQYQRAGQYQAPGFNSAGYEDIQLASQDFGKVNYGTLPSGGQTKTVPSAAGSLPSGVNEGNKNYAGGLKTSFDGKSFVQGPATMPSLNNMTFPAAYQTSATTGASYGYPNYMPPVNMNMLASPMAAVQLSSDVMGPGPMNQHGGNQNSKTGVGKPLNQFAFPSWGN